MTNLSIYTIITIENAFERLPQVATDLAGYFKVLQPKRKRIFRNILSWINTNYFKLKVHISPTDQLYALGKVESNLTFNNKILKETGDQLRPRPCTRIQTFFFPDSKIFSSTRSVFKWSLPILTYSKHIRIHFSVQDTSRRKR